MPLAVRPFGVGGLRPLKEATNGIDADVERGFHPDVEPEAQIWRLRDRVFIGDAAAANGNFTGNQGAWPTNAAAGPSWIIRDSTFIASAPNGNIAIAGLARSSDRNTAATTVCGVVGAALGDVVGGSPRAFYGDVSNEACAFAVGMELAVKNRKSEVTADAYTTSDSGNGTFGMTINTGDNAYGGDGLYNGTAAMTIAGGNSGNTSRWNLGIMFQAASLTVDGNSRSTAMAFGQKTGMKWYVSAGVLGSEIRGDNNTSGANTSLVFEANTINHYGPNEKRVFQSAYVTNAVNYVKTSGSITANPVKIEAAGDDTNIGGYIIAKGQASWRFMMNGGTTNEDLRVGGGSSAPTQFLHIYGRGSGSAPVVAAAGSDTNIDIALVPKGSGVVMFGTRTANGDASITGYLTIKDSGGTTRKLAIID